MNDVREQIKFFINSIWQRRFYVLAVAWFVCATGWIVVATMPNMYQSSARIFIDTSNVLRPLLKGLAVETDVDAEVESMRRALTNRASLLRVARLTDLDLTASTPAEMERLLNSLKSRTDIKSEGPKLLRVSFIDSDPERARDVTEALITTFIDLNIGHGQEDINSARQFLDSQIANYERQLQDAEQKLAQFKQEKLSKLPNQASAQLRIDSLNSDRLEAEAALRRATARRDLLRQQLESPAAAAARDPRLLEMETELSDLLSRYTEQHPEVIALRRKIAALRTQLAQELETGTPMTEDDVEAAASSDSTASTRDEIQLELSKQETDISFYAGRIARISNKIDELEAAIAQAPEIEAEYTRLNRDYNVLRAKYEELVSRREQARISSERDIRSEDVKFEILEPPHVPKSPTGPSRSLLLVVSLVGGLGAGVGFALLLSLVNDTVRDSDQLRQAFGLPILGTISVIDNFRNHSVRVAQTTGFIAGLTLLLAVFGGLMAVERGSGLAQLASNKHIRSAYQGVDSVSGRLRAVISELVEKI